MFVAKSRQKTIFDLEFDLPEKMSKRIKNTWAEVFLQVILPILIKAEKDFADLYCKNNGAPNVPVALLLGVLILKDIFDLTDEETLEHLEYNLLWQYALDIRFEDAHICRKTLHNFREKLLQSGWHRKIFNRLTKKIIELFGLNVGTQRLDSTHIVGNMKILGRLALFIQTIEQFLFKLKKMAEKDSEIARILKELPEQFYKRYLDREGYFGDVRNSQAPRRLQTCAQDVWDLLQIFGNNPKILELKQFQSLQRLFKEQCEVVNFEGDQVKIEAKLPSNDEEDASVCSTPPENVADQSKEPEQDPKAPTIDLKKKEDVGSDSLQSPTDPDATYGHKGKGYECQIAETCSTENPFEVITETHLNGANESDQTKTIPMIDMLEDAGLKPEELHVDAGYVSGKNIVEAEDRGTDLIGPLPGKPASEKISLEDFQFNQDGTRIEQCPNQKFPIQQGDSNDNKEHWAIFSKGDCSACPFFENCPVKGKRVRRIEWDRESQAIAKRHKECKTPEFKEKHKIRSGIEATNSELKNKHGAANLKVVGYKRIDLAMTFKALAVNVKRMILYVVAEIKRRGIDGIEISIASLVCILSSVFLIFIGFAMGKWAKSYFLLKNLIFDITSAGKSPINSFSFAFWPFKV